MALFSQNFLYHLTVINRNVKDLLDDKRDGIRTCFDNRLKMLLDREQNLFFSSYYLSSVFYVIKHCSQYVEVIALSFPMFKVVLTEDTSSLSTEEHRPREVIIMHAANVAHKSRILRRDYRSGYRGSCYRLLVHAIIWVC